MNYMYGGKIRPLQPSVTWEFSVVNVFTTESYKVDDVEIISQHSVVFELRITDHL